MCVNVGNVCSRFETSTHLDRPTYPKEYHDSYFRTRFSDEGGKIVSKPRKRHQSRLSLLHPLFNPSRLPYLVFADKSGVSHRVGVIATFTGGPIWCLVGGKEGSLDRPQRAGKRLGCKAGRLLGDFLGDVCIAGTNTFHMMSSLERKRVDRDLYAYLLDAMYVQIAGNPDFASPMS